MKAGIKGLEYVVVEPKTYLVVTLEENAHPMDFCLDMVQRNQIRGLLPVQRQMEDGETILYFDVSEKRRLTNQLQSSAMTEEHLLRMLDGLCQDLTELSEYFLQINHCLLDPEYTYVDPYGRLFQPLVPLEGDEDSGERAMQSYLTALLGKMISIGQIQTGLIPTLIAYAVQPDFRLGAFRSQLKAASPLSHPESEPSAPVISPRPAAEKPPAPIASQHTDVPPKIEKTPNDVSVSIPGQGQLLIPNAPNAAPEKKRGKEKGKSERKKSDDKKPRFGALFGKKGEKVDLEKEPPVFGGSAGTGICPPNVPSAISVPPIPHHEASSQPWKGTMLLESGATEVVDEDVECATLHHNGRLIPLTQFPFTIGRMDCHYVVDDPKVSRKHATLFFEHGQYYVQDEHSSNHTYVDHRAIPPYTKVELNNGSEIQIGNQLFRLTMGGH